MRSRPETLNSQDTPDLSAVVTRKARHGRSDWAVWKDAAGVHHAARVSAESIKAAMLATGTQRHWMLVARGSGIRFAQCWSLSCLLLRNVKRFGSNL